MRYQTRYVYAQRARTLRKRGESVVFDRWDAYGHCVYYWLMPRR